MLLPERFYRVNEILERVRADGRLAEEETALLFALPAASPEAMLLRLAGANLCWAEAGYNPRDRADKTELDGTGRAVESIARIYAETGWEFRHGPSLGWNMGKTNGWQRP